MVFARLLYCKVTIFDFAINKYFVGKYFDSINILFLIKLSLILAHISFGGKDAQSEYRFFPPLGAKVKQQKGTLLGRSATFFFKPLPWLFSSFLSYVNLTLVTLLRMVISYNL